MIQSILSSTLSSMRTYPFHPIDLCATLIATCAPPLCATLIATCRSSWRNNAGVAKKQRSDNEDDDDYADDGAGDHDDADADAPSNALLLLS